MAAIMALWALLPETLGDRTYYEYGENKTEQAAKRYWDEIKRK